MMPALRRSMSRGGDVRPEDRDLIASDVVRIDRRGRGVSAPAVTSSEEYLATVRAHRSVWDRIDGRTIAVRGDDLALARLEYASEDGYTLPYLSVYETDADGRVVRIATFDEDDLAAAVDELDDRWAVRRDDEPGEIETLWLRQQEAIRARDLDALSDSYAPDFVAIDHRPLGFPPASGADMVDRLRTALDAAPDFRGHGRLRVWAERAALTVIGYVGTTPEGTPYAWDLIHVLQSDGYGRPRRLEYFPEDRWDDAVARFGELRDEADERAARSVAGNRASEVALETTTVVECRDWDRFRRMCTDDVAADDRRHGVNSGRGLGVDHLLHLTQGLLDVGFTRVSQTTLAVAGERHAVLERIWHSPDDNDLVVIVLVEIDDDGRVCANTLFDPADLTDAIAEMHRRAAP